MSLTAQTNSPHQQVQVYGRERSDAWRGTKAVTLAFMVTGLAALVIGVFFGPLQALNYAGLDAYSAMQPAVKSYYQGLTVHGVMNAFVFTTFFMSGLMYYLTARELEEAPSLVASWTIFAVMFLGFALTLGSIAANQASVLYTFYAPMLANGAFYIGLGLVFGGSWFVGLQILNMRQRWRMKNPGRVTPLAAWMSAVTMIMWFIGSLGAVSAIILWHLPAAMGWISGMPPMITRTLFWWTGHPIVYFWLMPAYISWYTLVPRQVGGVLISDPLARVSFILLMIFSLPVGTHHQLMDAGIPPVMRAIVIFLTFSVVLPSLLTAFTVGASLEYAARHKGGQGAFQWFSTLPWHDPSVTAQVLAMLLFIIGGASGLVNASWAVNAVVHNTTWVPGHFHATVASASALTFFGVAFWMIPHLTSRPLAFPRLALWGSWGWFVGMFLFSNGMMVAGLLGVPRRAWVSGMTSGGGFASFYGNASLPLWIVGISGVILGAAAFSILVVLFASLFWPRAQNFSPPAIPFTTAFGSPHGTRMVAAMDRLWLWTAISVFVLAAIYVPVLWSEQARNIPLAGMRVW